MSDLEDFIANSNGITLHRKRVLKAFSHVDDSPLIQVLYNMTRRRCASRKPIAKKAAAPPAAPKIVRKGHGQLPARAARLLRPTGHQLQMTMQTFPQKRHATSPIEEVICEFEFSQVGAWDPHLPTRLYDEMRSVYPTPPQQVTAENSTLSERSHGRRSS